MKKNRKENSGKTPGEKRTKRRHFLSGTEKGSVKTAVLFIVILAFCVLPAVFINNIFGYLPVFLFLFVLILCRIYLNILTRSLVYEDQSEFHSCMRKESMEFRIRIENRSFLVYPYVKICFFMTDLFGDRDSGTETMITLAPKEKRDFVFDVRFDHVGRYSAGLEKIEIRGLLGVRKVTMPGGAEHSVEVYPHIWDLAEMKISEKVQTEDSKSKQSIDADGGDYTGVREYAMGDPIKNIHWKLSAHSNEYLTKQMETFGSSGVSIIMDLCGSAGNAEKAACLFDALVETAVSVGCYARDRGLECDIAYLSGDGKERYCNTGESDFQKSLIWDIPPVADRREDYDVMRLLDQADRSMYGRSNIILCTACLTPEIARKLISMRMHGKNPVAFFIIPDDVYDREREDLLAPARSLDGQGIVYYVLSDAEELQ